VNTREYVFSVVKSQAADPGNVGALQQLHTTTILTDQNGKSSKLLLVDERKGAILPSWG